MKERCHANFSKDENNWGLHDFLDDEYRLVVSQSYNVVVLFVIYISLYGRIESKTMFECIASALQDNASAGQCKCSLNLGAMWLHCGCVAVALWLHWGCIAAASNIQKGVILNF